MSLKISVCDRVMSRFYYALENIRPSNLKESVGLGLAAIAYHLSNGVGFAISLGYLGYKWAVQKPTFKIQGRSYIAKKIPVESLIRWLGEVKRISKNSQTGIIRDKGEGSYICTDYVSSFIEPYTQNISLYNTVNQLKKHGYKAVEIPKENDIILYFRSEDKKEQFEHVGIVSAVDHGIVWVDSKWGRNNLFEHLEEAVPECYGDAVVYLRKIADKKAITS